MDDRKDLRKYQRSSSSHLLKSETFSSVSRAKSFQEKQTSPPHFDRPESNLLLEDLVQCGICMDKLTDPRMLPCQHTFCFDCLDGHLFATIRKSMGGEPTTEQIQMNIAENEQEFKCPMCKIGVKIQKNGLKDLPKNMYINLLLPLVERNSNSSSNNIKHNSTPEITCVNCQKACKGLEKKCKHCKQVFCDICWSDHVSKLKSNFIILINHLDESKMRLKHRINDFHDRCGKMETTIKRTAKEMIFKINSQEENILKKLGEIEVLETGSAKVLEKSVDLIRKELEAVSFDSISNDEDKVKTVMDLNRKVAKVISEASRWGDSQMIFDPKSFKLNYSNEYLETNQNGDEEGDTTDFQSIKNPMESVETMIQHYRKKSGNPKLVWTKCPRPAGVGIPPWAPHLLYIAATEKQIVLIMDRYISKVVGKLSVPDIMLCPQGLAFSEKRSEIFVSDKWKHCIHVFSSDGDYDRTLCSLGGGNSELRSPESIAFNRQGELIVCDAGNDRVILLSPVDGQQISTLGMIKNCTEFSIPTGVAVHNDKIIITDNGNHKIKIFSETGEKLGEFGTMGNIKGQFTSAQVVACDPLGFILVGDSGNARIQIFDPYMNLVRVIGGYGETPGMFSWVSGLTVTPQLEIVVTDYKNRRLQIF